MITGLWLPIITPFKDNAVDFKSYERLIEHYLALGVDGLFPLGTTGESPTLEDAEIDELVERTVATVAGRVPVLVGVGSNATAKVEKTVKRLERHAFDGIVSVCPYYNRPSQDGLLAHFRAIAAATDRDVLIYNIPYRTAVNLSNDSLIELAEVSNIVGVKDSSGSIAQSLELLARKPKDFSVLTGEDALYFTMMANGAEGGILVEREQEGVDGADAAGQEGPAGQLDQAVGIEPRQFLGMLVVERQYARGLRGIERLYLLHEGVCYAASRSPTMASSRFASPSEMRVNGRRHSGEAISPCRHNRYLIGIGLASANSSGTRGASGAQHARAPATSLSAKRRPTSTKRPVMTWLAARMPPSAPLAIMVK